MDSEFPQAGRNRLVLSAPVGIVGTEFPNRENECLATLGPDTAMMMGDNPALSRMPKAPTLMDFFQHRFQGITERHLLISAQKALEAGMDEAIVMAVLLHDISNGCLIRSDHGYWSAQLVAPYVSEEVAFAIQYHQALRYYADEANGYAYPESYNLFFGADYVPPDYIARDAAFARNHKWYMSARFVTIFDTYFFDEGPLPNPAIFTDIIGRHFKTPEQGLGFDSSPTAHMWRTMIWPNNFL
jgi:hypothetical protein